MSRHIVRATYDEFKSSTNIIPQGNLTSDGGIFFTVHTTVIRQTCST
jgi:NADH:ubiquinone oxidoreductase subunit B-like Fe-S oxidoreductase